MSRNKYELTQPSQELTIDVTKTLAQPYSPKLQALLADHLQRCQQCGTQGRGLCTTAQEMVAEADYLAHRQDCPICKGEAMCPEGYRLFQGD